jgi:DNA-binding FadR family transcriptional regulator
MSLKSIKPVKRAPLLHISVQESLRGFINDNNLSAGSALPAEGDLALQLGVSRNSVREGIKALESVGVLESRRGIGVFVKAFSFEPLLDNLAYGLGSALQQIEEVITIRRTLEVGLIEKTLATITPKEIGELRDVLEKMRLRAENNESFPDEDKLFHHLLFRSQENEILLRLLEVFWMAFYKASDFVNLNNSDPMETWREHTAIVDAIEAGDVEAAKQQLDKHYDGISRVIKQNKPHTKVEI